MSTKTIVNTAADTNTAPVVNEKPMPESVVDYRKNGGEGVDFKADVVKCGIAPAALKKTGMGDYVACDVGAWCIVVYLKGNGRITAADFVYKTLGGDLEFVEYAKNWSTQDYAIHYCGKLADKICAGRVTAMVADRLAEADVRVRNAQEKAESTRKWNKAHRDEKTLDTLSKRAAAAVKGAVSQTVKEYAQGVHDKCEKYLAILRSDVVKTAEKTNLDDALEFLDQLKAEKAAARKAS